MNGGPKERPKSKVTRATRLLASSITRIRAKRGSRTLLAGPFRSEYPHKGISIGGVMSVRATPALNSAARGARAVASKRNTTRIVASRRFQFVGDGYSCAQFPLTPALSLGEREHRRLILRKSDALTSRQNLAAILPLPKGEGWGEGEGAVEISRALRLCNCLIRFVFMRSMFCS